MVLPPLPPRPRFPWEHDPIEDIVEYKAVRLTLGGLGDGLTMVAPRFAAVWMHDVVDPYEDAARFEVRDRFKTAISLLHESLEGLRRLQNVAITEMRFGSQKDREATREDLALADLDLNKWIDRLTSAS